MDPGCALNGFFRRLSMRERRARSHIHHITQNVTNDTRRNHPPLVHVAPIHSNTLFVFGLCVLRVHHYAPPNPKPHSTTTFDPIALSRQDATLKQRQA